MSALVPRDDEALLPIDEPCPHCGVQLHLGLSRDEARHGFDCPECRTGLLVRQGRVATLKASASFLFAWLFLAAFSCGYGVLGVWLVQSLIASFQLSLEAMTAVGVGGVLYLMVGYGVLHSFARITRTVRGIVSGRKLLPAIKTDEGVYRFDVMASGSPRPTASRRRRGEPLGGAVSLADGETAQRGALSSAAHGGEVALIEEEREESP